MNQRERARLLASLTDDEVTQLRERLSSNATSDADRKFASDFFAGRTTTGDDQDQDQDAGEYTDEQRQWARELFAPDDEDANVLPGLTDGRSVSRTSPPRHDDIPRDNFNFS
ncbi:hypothetical protein A5753_00745 [Mycobacterium sp. 852002-51971_SCH5477799-a]|uniref:hypothetical protein n=1 Tax=Mycobacterium sp. 852002-51971_SCH5477799-a TaxID=1834106 RepID=UPI0007FDEF93|nr:hypothetical protein [Mycobacterium sp. 852002-51971_SCH5477799-a]OBF65858.1 hypothetical protein A5753_00745 [Mycobacterium sp. 852002-51971_SCH5477799-a]